MREIGQNIPEGDMKLENPGSAAKWRPVKGYRTYTRNIHEGTSVYFDREMARKWCYQGHRHFCGAGPSDPPKPLS